MPGLLLDSLSAACEGGVGGRPISLPTVLAQGGLALEFHCEGDGVVRSTSIPIESSLHLKKVQICLLKTQCLHLS